MCVVFATSHVLPRHAGPLPFHPPLGAFGLGDSHHAPYSPMLLVNADGTSRVSWHIIFHLFSSLSTFTVLRVALPMPLSST